LAIRGLCDIPGNDHNLVNNALSLTHKGDRVTKYGAFHLVATEILSDSFPYSSPLIKDKGAPDVGANVVHSVIIFIAEEFKSTEYGNGS